MDGPARRLDAGREYFKIGELAKALGTTPSAIRFYQSRFKPHIRPVKTRTLRNLFSRRDAQILRVILVLRREYGLSVTEARERMHDLLVKHNGDPFAIEAELRKPQADERGAEAAPPGHYPPGSGQGELPLDSVGRLEPDEPGLREPAPAIPNLAQRVRDLEREVAVTKRDLQVRDRELAQARRTLADQSARLREMERALHRTRTELHNLRLRIRQAVHEIFLDLSGENPVQPS